VHQPYASLIAAGVKRYETRSWQPGRRLRARHSILLIHSSKANGDEQRGAEMFIGSRFPDAINQARGLWDGVYPRFPQGMIVAAVRYMGAHPVAALHATLDERERAVGNYKDGRWAWELDLLKVPDRPIPVRGQQGIWFWEGAIT
jgi:hypothetical protein